MIPPIGKYLESFRNLKMTKEELETFQLKKIRKIVEYSYENTSFYNNSMKKTGIRPSDIKKLSDLNKLPILTKNEIQSISIDNFLGKKNAYKIKRTTSGSTGKPLTVYLDPLSELQDNIEWTRALFRDGMSIWDKMAVISDPRYFPKKRFYENFGLIRRQYISIFEKSSKQLNNLIDYHPDIIRGYPSNLLIMLHENPDVFKKIAPRLIFTSGELLDKGTRDFISESYKCEHFDFYVCNEFSLLAWECSSHKGYHINADSKYIEIIKDGEIAAPDERGEIIVTRFNNPVMPLIRYKIGDIGSIRNDPCSCGVNFPLLDMVEGRTDDLMITTNGYIVTPLIFFPYPFKSYEGIYQFRVIQENRYKITIELAADMDLLYEDSLENARRSIKDVFGEDMEVDFSIVEKIEPEPNGKIKKIISKVKVPL